MNRFVSAGILLAAAFAAGAPTAWAAPVTVPSGLQPGDQYRLVFVTSTQTMATSYNLADYNAFVTAVANSVPELAVLGTTWSAIASTGDFVGEEDAFDNTNSSPFMWIGVPFYNVGGELVASDNNDLWDGTISNPIQYTEQGNLVGQNYYAWTGTNYQGMEFYPYPVGGGDFGYVIIGNASAVDSSWIASAQYFNSDQLALYAMSGVLTVVPEPSAVMLSGLAALLCMTCHVRRRRSRR
jgi:hypothetical protein